MDPRDIERFRLRQWREKTRQSPGQHGLARPGRAGQEQVMPPGRGHFNRKPTESLTADVNQVRLSRTLLDSRGWGWLRPRPVAAQGVNQARKGRCGAHPVASDHSCLPGTCGRNDDGWLGDGVNKGHHSGDGANRAVQPELSDERHSLDVRREQHLARDEQGNGNREIQAGAALAHP
jgi:hypothetical protein